MDITPNLSEDRQVIQRYGGGVFVINGQEYDHSVVILPDGVSKAECLAPTMSSEVFADYLQDKKVDILLLGTGVTQYFIPPAFRAEIKQQYGAVIEAMDTGAACRTYNVLIAEDRNVVAILNVI